MTGVVISKTRRIPDHVIEEILRRLPVKSILRFTCMSKIWCSVISDAHFRANLHGRRPSVLICENSNKFSTTTTESKAPPTPLPLPWETNAGDQNQVLGSCRGLVCVDFKSRRWPFKNGLILWNPSTRKFRKLPRPPTGYYQFYADKWFTYAWFGHDELAHDYKLVWLNCGLQCRMEHGVLHVFLMKSNTWRRVPIDGTQEVFLMHYEKLVDRNNPKSIGFFCNGAIHWCISYWPPGASDHSYSNGFLAFDLGTEKFQLLKFPPRPLIFPSHTWVGTMGGCLCISTNLDNKIDYAVTDGHLGLSVWRMKEYGSSRWCRSGFFRLEHDRFPYFRYLSWLARKESKEVVALFDYMYAKMWDCEEDEMVRLRILGGGEVENVRFEETRIRLNQSKSEVENVRFEEARLNQSKSKVVTVVLPMEESLASLDAM